MRWLRWRCKCAVGDQLVLKIPLAELGGLFRGLSTCPLRPEAARSCRGPNLSFAMRAVQGSAVSAGGADAQRFISSLQKIENGAGRYGPGSLLLAQDPNDLNRSAFPDILPLASLACKSGQAKALKTPSSLLL